jgi:hypothetical protein
MMAVPRYLPPERAIASSDHRPLQSEPLMERLQGLERRVVGHIGCFGIVRKRPRRPENMAMGIASERGRFEWHASADE